MWSAHVASKDDTPAGSFTNQRARELCGVCFCFARVDSMVNCLCSRRHCVSMSSATAIVCSGGLFWLNPVAMDLFMLCSVVNVEWLFLKPCCVQMWCRILFVMW